MARSRFLIVKHIYPRIFVELTKELCKHVPECPHFSEEEIGFLVIGLLREEIIFSDPGGKSMSLPQLTHRDSIAIEEFVLSSRRRLIELYTKRRKKLFE